MKKFDFPEWLKDGRKHYLDYMRNVASQTFMAGLALLALLNLRKLALDPGLIACALMFTALCVMSFAANWSTSFDNIFSQYFAWEKRARQHVNRQTKCLKTRTRRILTLLWRNRRTELLLLPVWALFQLFVLAAVLTVAALTARGYVEGATAGSAASPAVAATPTSLIAQTKH